MEKYINSFITLFLAIDPIGIIPLYMSMGLFEKKQALKNSIIVALVIGSLFIFIGKSILIIVGITLNDLKIAGGILLIALSIKDLLSTKGYVEDRNHLNEDPIVPLAVPLVVGPATLTALLVCTEFYGYTATILSFIANLVLTYFTLSNSNLIIRVLGERGIKGLSKVSLLLLTAFGVSFIRRGIEGVVKGLS